MEKWEKEEAREEIQEQQLDRLHQWIDRHPVLQWLYCSIVIGYLGLTKASSVFLFLKLLALVLLVVIILLITGSVLLIVNHGVGSTDC